jgi:hypothetical protein
MEFISLNKTAQVVSSGAQPKSSSSQTRNVNLLVNLDTVFILAARL